jgi:hypothetical protein
MANRVRLLGERTVRFGFLVVLFLGPGACSGGCKAVLLFPALRVVLPKAVLSGATDIKGCLADECVALVAVQPGLLTDNKADPDAVYGFFERLDVGSRVEVRLMVKGGSPVDIKGTARVKVNGHGGCQAQPMLAVRYDIAAGTLSETSIRP